MNAARAIFLALILAPTVRADSISLRATARIAPGRDVRLGDVADLAGPAAEALADAVVLPAAELRGSWARIDLDRIRAAIDGPSIPWGILDLRGGACAVGPARALATGSPPPAPAAAAPAPQPAETIQPGTVKAHIAAKIAAALGAAPTALRLAFDPRDDDFLATTTAGRAVEVRLTGMGDRIPVRATVFEGESRIASRSISADALILRSVAVAARPIRRGAEIDAADLTVEDRWVGPSLSVVPPADAAGASAKTPLGAGQIITANDIQSPVVIKRGDLVTVSSISGAVIVRTTARARGAAREGEFVDLESTEPDRRLRRAFSARACAPGQAVIADTGDKP